MANIAYNLNESEYSVPTENFTYYFSSMLYLRKFVKQYMKHREQLCYKLSSRFNINIIAPDYFDFILYSEIEKRGFRIIHKRGEVFTCLKETVLSGEIRTLGNSKGL